MLYHNEIFSKLNIGDIKKAYVKTVRDDGKLDIVLQKIGVKNSDDDLYKIVEVLKSNNNYLEVTSKSDSELITKLFEMSKKRFKAALNTLITENRVILESNAIKLNH